MNDVMVSREEQYQEEPKFEFATVEIIYNEDEVLKAHKSELRILGEDYTPVEIIENYLPSLTSELSKRLTAELHIEVTIRISEVSEGSVKAVLTFLVSNVAFPIVLSLTSAYAYDDIKSALSDPSPEMATELEKYNKICTTTETVTEQTLREFDHRRFKSSEFKINTKTIETVCKDIKVSKD